MKISDIVQFLDSWASPSLAESYDNVGLLVGNQERELSAVLISLDVTEAVVAEAVARGCNLIVAHHPLIFKGLKRITPSTWVERTVIAAIENKVAIYAIHTNLDNLLRGVNSEIALRLDLRNTRILRPLQQNLEKWITYVPTSHLEQVKESLFKAGAGNIGNYSECSFESEGRGSYKPLLGSDPFKGQLDTRSVEKEVRLEVLARKQNSKAILKALFESHPYEEVAYDQVELKNLDLGTGAGMIGELEEEVSMEDFFIQLKSIFGLSILRHSKLTGEKVKRIALCGGSGSFLIGDAKASGAQVFITSDIKYHDFFEADDRLVLCDIGHYESEQFTSELIAVELKRNFGNFAVLLTEVSTNPIFYTPWPKN